MSEDIPADEAEITKAEVAKAQAEFAAATLDDDTFVLEQSDGRTELLSFDTDGTARIVETEDLSGVMDDCGVAFNDAPHRIGELPRIASLPQSILRAWGQSRGITDPFWFYDNQYSDLLLRAAHDRDLSRFRTRPGNFLRRGVRAIAREAV